jgi:hypothetical protein
MEGSVRSCPRCGATSPVTARYCQTCGDLLLVSAAPSERDRRASARTCDESWASLQMFGSGLVLIGGVAFIVSLFLHYVGTFSLWSVTTRWPVLLTILAAAAMVLALAAMTWDAPGICLGQAVLGAYLLGQVFPLEMPSYEHLGPGFWLETVGALAMAVGGSLAVVGNWRARSARLGTR